MYMIHHVLRNLTSLLQYTTNNKRVIFPSILVYTAVYSYVNILKNGRGHGDVSYYTKVQCMANQMSFSLLPDEHTSVRQEVTN